VHTSAKARLLRAT